MAQVQYQPPQNMHVSYRTIVKVATSCCRVVYFYASARMSQSLWGRFPPPMSLEGGRAVATRNTYSLMTINIQFILIFQSVIVMVPIRTMEETPGNQFYECLNNLFCSRNASWSPTCRAWHRCLDESCTQYLFRVLWWDPDRNSFSSHDVCRGNTKPRAVAMFFPR